MLKIEHEVWQREECRKLGITIEQHNAIMKVAAKIDLCMGKNYAYDYIIHLIDGLNKENENE